MKFTPVLISILFILTSNYVHSRPQKVTGEQQQTKVEDNVQEEILDGPAIDSPVVENSEKLDPWSLPMEHRHQLNDPITLPNTKSIPDSVYENLGVDLFFSLWFVFLNNEVSYTDQPFTILAPINASRTSPENFLNNEALAEEIITNHFLLGEKIRPEKLIKPQTRFTAGGQKLNFEIDRNGVMWVNNVEIVGWDIVNNGIILALNDYLYKEHINTQDILASSRIIEDSENTNKLQNNATNKEVTSTTTTTTTTTTSTTTTWSVIPDHWIKIEVCEEVKSPNSSFNNIVVCVEEFVDPESSKGQNELKKRRLSSSEKLVASARDESTHGMPNFLQDIVDILSVLRSGSNAYLHYIEKTDIRDYFKSDKKYTALIPYDEAFRSWSPIDWGFDPFTVDSFVKETLLNHFIEGEVDSERISSENVTFETLGGKNVTFNRVDKKLHANGIELLDEGVSVRHGDILFIEELLFVTYEQVDELNKEYPYLESGPLLPSPWFQSQFMSYSYSYLQKKEEFSYMTKYMAATEELGDYATRKNSELYTLFVPRDDAFWRIQVKDQTAPDPFMLDKDFRLQALLGHLVDERFFLKDFLNGTEIKTVNNKTLTILRNQDKITLNDGRQSAEIIGSEHYMYNRGIIYVIDKVLFTQFSDILPILQTYEDNNSETPTEASFESEFDVDSEKIEDSDEGEWQVDDMEELDETSEDEIDDREEIMEKLEEKGPKEEMIKLKDISRGTRRDTDDERLYDEKELLDTMGTLITFPEGWSTHDVEEKVIFINNQKISILRQKDH